MQAGQYIWRTVQDNNVRSAHAAREGKIFSWNNPPPGGHPGQDYNYRCWAEAPNCRDLWWKLWEISRKLKPLDHKLSVLGMEIHNLEEQIKGLESDIKWLGYEAIAYEFGNILGKTAGILVVAKVVEIKDEKRIKLQLWVKKTRQREELKRGIRSLKNQYEIADSKYNECVGGSREGKRKGPQDERVVY